jgi:hypothetical protein
MNSQLSWSHFTISEFFLFEIRLKRSLDRFHTHMHTHPHARTCVYMQNWICQSQFTHCYVFWGIKSLLFQDIISQLVLHGAVLQNTVFDLIKCINVRMS